MEEDTKQKQQPEQGEQQQLHGIGQRCSAASAGDTSSCAHEMQGVVRCVKAFGVAEATLGAKQTLGGEVQRDVGGEGDGGREGAGDAKADKGERCVCGDGRSWCE